MSDAISPSFPTLLPGFPIISPIHLLYIAMLGGEDGSRYPERLVVLKMPQHVAYFEPWLLSL